jgi:hypothetical protein
LSIGLIRFKGAKRRIVHFVETENFLMKSLQLLDTAAVSHWIQTRLGGSLSRRTVLTPLAAGSVASGLFLSWDWLVGAGLSSIIVGLLPCAAMCAAGLCMRRFGRKNACSDGDPTASREADKASL